MRIALVSYEYPPQQGLGGVGTYMFRLAGALGERGHEVHVIAGPSDRAPVQQHNVFLHRIPAHYELHSENRALRFFYWQGLARFMSWTHPAIWHWIKWDLASYDAIKALDANHPFDLVEAPEHAANGWMAGHLHRWPILLRMHCPWELFVRINRFPFNPMNRVLSWLERLTVAEYADGITVPSNAMRNVVADKWKLRRAPLIIPNFMDVPEQQAPLPAEDGPQRIVCVGRIEPLKGQDVLARAFAWIAARHPKAVLTFVGPDRWPGPLSFEQLLPKLVPDPDARRRIELPGAVPLEKVASMLRSASIAVSASRGFESFSYAALESLAAARPTIVTDTGALPELIEHEACGLVVPSGDPPRMAEAMDRLLCDRRLSQTFATAGFERARQRYHTPQVIPQVLAAYEDASDYYYQVECAGSERTALRWRDALDAAEAAAEDERAHHDEGSSPGPDSPGPPPMRVWRRTGGSVLPMRQPRCNVA